MDNLADILMLIPILALGIFSGYFMWKVNNEYRQRRIRLEEIIQERETSLLEIRKAFEQMEKQTKKKTVKKDMANIKMRTWADYHLRLLILSFY